MRVRRRGRPRAVFAGVAVVVEQLRHRCGAARRAIPPRPAGAARRRRPTANTSKCGQRAADACPGARATPRESTKRGDAALGAAPVLEQDGAPPLDHALLHVGRDRRGAVQHGVERGRMEGGALLVGEAQQARTNIVGTRCVWWTSRSAIQRSASRSSQRGITRMGAPSGCVVDRVHERRRVIERAGDEVRARSRRARSSARTPAARRAPRRASPATRRFTPFGRPVVPLV